MTVAGGFVLLHSGKVYDRAIETQYAIRLDTNGFMRLLDSQLASNKYCIGNICEVRASRTTLAPEDPSLVHECGIISLTGTKLRLYDL